MKRLAALALFAVLAAPVNAQQYKVGDLTLQNAWARPTPKGAKVGAAYVTIANSGKTADRLMSATAEDADKVELHETSMADGVMKMRPLPNGLEIPAGGKVEMKPGSYHFMLMGLKAPIVAGAPAIKGSLTFEHAGKVDVNFAPMAMPASEHAH